MSRPEVTVVTPTLNAINFFEETLRSIAEQRADVEIEHIVVDDGSHDGTVELARKWGADVLRGHNKGLYEAMNLGLARASCGVVGVLNADDCLLPGGLLRLCEAIRHTGRPWAVGALRWVDADGTKLGDLKPPPTWVPVRTLASLPWSYIGHPSTYMRNGFWQELGGFDTSLPVAADFDLFMRARLKSRYARVAAATTTFRRHGANASSATGQLHVDAGVIAERYGPRTAVGRSAGRTVAAALANGLNPRWSRGKRRHL